MKPTREQIDALRARTPLSAVIREAGIALSRVGRDFQGVCPDCHKPDLVVVDSRGLYVCFACKRAGDVVKFVQRDRNLSFVGAVNFLLERVA